MNFTKVIAVDPGTTDSAYIVWDGVEISEKGIIPNEKFLEKLGKFGSNWTLVIEKFECYGMAIGEESIETIFWSGRFAQRWQGFNTYSRFDRIGRKCIKRHLCGSHQAKDGNIRQALIDRFGAPGTKKSPGLTYGVASHLWAAFAVAVTWWDLNEGEKL